MGYDMYLTDLEQTDVSTQQAEFTAAVEARDAFFSHLTRTQQYEARQWQHWDAGFIEQAPTPELLAQPHVVAYRDLQAAVTAALERQYELRGYFRLNIWGMRECREHMATAGMLLKDVPGWAKYVAPSKRMFPELPEAADDPDDEAYHDRIEALLQHAAHHPDEMDPRVGYWIGPAMVRDAAQNRCGIATLKLCSNDGWLVTPEECRIALASYAAFVQRHPEHAFPDWWPEWIVYLERGIVHGGFRVH